MTGNESLIISQRTMTEAEPHAGKIISVKNGGKSGKQGEIGQIGEMGGGG